MYTKITQLLLEMDENGEAVKSCFFHQSFYLFYATKLYSDSESFYIGAFNVTLVILNSIKFKVSKAIRFKILVDISGRLLIPFTRYGHYSINKVTLELANVK